MIFDMFEIFDSICMCLKGIPQTILSGHLIKSVNTFNMKKFHPLQFLGHFTIVSIQLNLTHQLSLLCKDAIGMLTSSEMNRFY
jgi:hypothetical protein